MYIYIYTYYNIFTEITITPTSINPPCHHQEIAGLILDSFNGLPSCRLLEDQMFQFFWKARNDFVLRKIQEKKLRWNNSQSLAVVSGCKTILCCGQMMHYFTRLDQGGFSEISQVPSPLNKHPGQQKHLFNLSTIHAPIWRIQPGSKVAASEQHRNCLWFNGNFRILKWRYCII